MTQRDSKFENWLRHHHPLFVSLTGTFELIVRRLLSDAKIPFLAVSGRTKSIEDCLRKAERKKYKNAPKQMTDISGIRIVLYFDYHVSAVSKIIERAFNVDKYNSSNRDDILSVNEVGYRSIHYVCDLGSERAALIEHNSLIGLKFEFQVRTVLQHAWAELAHDRSYKFSGKLPKEIERRLFLLAALMETADNGFSELSQQLDRYIDLVSSTDNLEVVEDELNAITLERFVSIWAKENNIDVSPMQNRDAYDELIRELNEYGVTRISELLNIIPERFAEIIPNKNTNILGLVRDWMILFDPDHFLSNVEAEWVLLVDDLNRYRAFLDNKTVDRLVEKLGVDDAADDFEWSPLQEQDVF